MAEMEGAPICKIGEEQVHLGLWDDNFCWEPSNGFWELPWKGFEGYGRMKDDDLP